jgi:hypothetical protein
VTVSSLRSDRKGVPGQAEADLGRRLSAPEHRRLSERAVLATRPAKAHGPSAPGTSEQGLHDRWRADAVLGPQYWLGDVLDRTAARHQVALDEVVEACLEELARSSSTWADATWSSRSTAALRWAWGAPRRPRRCRGPSVVPCGRPT